MASLTDEQIESFYLDGFIILRNVVPQKIIDAARRRIYQDLGSLRDAAITVARSDGNDSLDILKESAINSGLAGTDPAILDLVNKSDLKQIIENALGTPMDSTGAQLVNNFPASSSRRVNEAGYRDCDTPFFGWHGHLDGLWNGATGVHQDLEHPMTQEQLEAWEQSPATNGVERSYVEHNSNIANFTALLGIPLSDQTMDGVGNLGLLKGAHHHIEKFFQRQRDAGGPLGPDGPDWPRIHEQAPNGCGLRHFPEQVRQAFSADAATTPDGHIWPRPTLIKVAPGDAVIALHATPHSATRVEGSEPRIMVYFRIRPENRPEGNERVYPDALCDIWMEWKGISDQIGKLKRSHH